MTSQEIIINQIQSTYVNFTVSQHMLKNSEMNATQPIRDFLRNEGLFDFSILPEATKKYLETTVIFNGAQYPRRVRLGYPPNKKEARFWVFGLNEFLNPDEEVLMCKIDNRLILIPLNQQNADLNDLKGILDLFELSNEAKSDFKKQTKSRRYKARKKDYIKQALLNTKLGLAGEVFVMAWEKSKLLQLGLPELVDRVDHKSVSEGDGLGYDILSFDSNGNEIYIEVKTTKGNLDTEFYISESELNFSYDFTEKYRLYRVYHFLESEKKGNIKIVSGDLRGQIEFSPVSHKGRITG